MECLEAACCLSNETLEVHVCQTVAQTWCRQGGTLWSKQFEEGDNERRNVIRAVCGPLSGTLTRTRIRSKVCKGIERVPRLIEMSNILILCYKAAWAQPMKRALGRFGSLEVGS